jgi:hypothetical protein
MVGTALCVNSKPCPVDSLPFATEFALQRFVKKHAEDLLGLKVVGVAERGGGTISKIDLLGVDRLGHPWIIECKHDLVNYRAVVQLQRYRSAILERWERIQKIIAAKFRSIRLQNHPQPRLLTIGYRYDRNLVAATDITCLAYRYHGIEFTPDKFQTRSPGRVSLHRVENIALPTQPHPRVSKEKDTLPRLAQLDSTVAASFHDFHGELNGLTGVEINYNKNLVWYRTARGVFATAAICPGRPVRHVVEWRPRGGRVVTLRVPADAPEVMKALRKAHKQKG